MQEIRADELEKLLPRRLGLIAGPGLSFYPGILSDLAAALAKEFDVPESRKPFEVADAALEAGAADEALRAAVRTFLDAQSPSPVLAQLAKTRWSAILSFSLDSHLEYRLKREAEKSPARHTITVLEDASQVPPPKTVPAYKMLGSSDRDRFAYSTTTYLLRKTGWRRIIKDFADRVKDSAVLCLGLGDCLAAFQELLAEMASQASTAPSSILFLADDPLHENLIIRRLIGQRSRITTVRGSLGDLVKAASKADKKGYSPVLSFPEEHSSPYHELRPFHELAIVVNECMTTDIRAEQHQQLLEMLFSPDIPSWAPIVHGLDFRRGLIDGLMLDLRRILTSLHPEFSQAALVIHGRAASGKTMLLKRLAWELAKGEDLVIWLRPIFAGEAGHSLRHLFEKIAKIKALRGKRVIVFLDDPVKSTSFQPREILSAAQSTNTQVVLVAGFRSTDWTALDPSNPLESFAVVEPHELPDVLDADEWARLPEYLVKLGICASLDDARGKIQDSPTRQARDTLSMLYYLLPQTRAMIASSVKDEYFRLGDQAGLTNVLLKAASQSTAVLKDAYEMVAVAGHFRTPLPLEVLVTALEIDYDDWVTATNTKGPAWGILYTEDFEEGETVCYRVRNDLVIHILMDAINGGSLGHAADLDIMRKLLAACSGSTPVYREFCVRVLVKNPAIDKYEFEDILRLYDQALESLPLPDKTILHHKARWIRKRGRDPIEAGRVLDQALAARPYPFTRRTEIDEHIHTTYAASIIDAIQQKLVSPADGKREVLQHLDRARSFKYLDPHAVHTQANLIVKLARQEESIKSPDSVQLVGRALSEVDRALLLIGNPHVPNRRSNNDVRMLESIREDVFAAMGSVEELRAHADEIWEEYRGQQGFVLTARKLFQQAIEKGRGSAFKKAMDYCQLSINKIKAEDATPSPSLYEVALHIYYRWQIQPAQLARLDHRIDWERIEGYCKATLLSPALAPDPFYKYLLAVASAHLGRWTHAHALLADLKDSGIVRDFLWEPRDYLLGEEGGPRTVQGEMRRGGHGLYFFAEELHSDFQIEKFKDWPREREIAHAHIRFHFGGARATPAGP